MSTDIYEIHRQCLDLLLEYQSKNHDFYFVPRKKNNDNRLKNGMYFRGNEEYLALSFWDSSDDMEVIYNVSFSVDSNGRAYIDLTCRDNHVERLPHIIAIKELLEAGGKSFDEPKTFRWRCSYPVEFSYLDALQEFILKVKPIIDNYVLSHPECNIPRADKIIDEKYVKTLPGYKEYKEAVNKTKKTGTVLVRASEHMMTFQHNELSNEMVLYLQTNGYSSVVAEENFVDIKAVDKNGELLFFELKTAMSVKNAIRQALGQLLEYNHYQNESKADKLFIVTPSKASGKDVQYLVELRKIYNIPVYYCQFDMDKKVLLEEC